VDSGAGPERVVPARRVRAAVRAADPRDRPAGGAVRALLPRARGLERAFLRAAAPVHGLDAGRRAVGEPAAARDVLGTHEPELVPAHRVLAARGRGASRRAPGAHDHRRRRTRAAGGRPAARARRRQLRAHAGARVRRDDQGAPAVRDHPGAGAARGVHQVGAVPVPLLAAARHGRAHAGERLPALGDHGEGGHLPARAAVPRTCRHGGLVLRGERRGPHDPVVRLVRRAVPARPQGPARLFDRQPPRPRDPAVRPRYAARRDRSGVPHHQPRRVQGLAVHGRRHHRPRDRHPGHAPAERARALHALDGRARHDRGGRHGGRAAAERLPQQGDVLRRDLPGAVARAVVLGDAGCRDARRHLHRGVLDAIRARRVLRARAAGIAEDPARAATLDEGAGRDPGRPLPAGRPHARAHRRPAAACGRGRGAAGPAAGVLAGVVARLQPAGADERRGARRWRRGVLHAPLPLRPARLPAAADGRPPDQRERREPCGARRTLAGRAGPTSRCSATCSCWCWRRWCWAWPARAA